MKGLAAEKYDYRGVIYFGLMLTAGGPSVLEFNVRFGDPEAQVYLPRLENDLLDLLEACLDGTLAKTELRWRPETAVCVVMAAAGYPGTPAKGALIRGLAEAGAPANTKIFHAGVARQGDGIVTHGGRVLGVTAWGAGLKQARDRAYEAVARIKFDGAQFRRDIGAKALRG